MIIYTLEKNYFTMLKWSMKHEEFSASLIFLQVEVAAIQVHSMQYCCFTQTTDNLKCNNEDR